MFSIYICEMQKELLNYYQLLINNYILMENLDIQVAAAVNSPGELLDILSSNSCSQPGLYFLNIDFQHEMNGIALAHQIRKYDPRGFIVFITALESFLPEVLESNIEVMNFIIQKASADISSQIISCIKIAFERFASCHNTIQKTLSLSLHDKTFVYNLNEIICIQSAESHTIKIHTLQTSNSFRGSLSSIAQFLDGRFFRCHNSYIINLNYISKINHFTYTLTLRNGFDCTVSRRKMHILKKIINQL